MVDSQRSYHSIAPAGDSVRVVQVTDTHLCHEPGGRLLGVDTDHSLRCVLDLVRSEQETIDLVLGTGDLSDNGARAAYERLQAYLAGVDAPSFWLPGNHDDRGQMEAVADDPRRMARELRSGNWQVLLLDSQIPGAVGGELGPTELAALETALDSAAQAGLYTLVCLHHQPVPVGCAWLDEQMVADADALFGVLEQFAGVRGVLWGHVHQQLDRRHGDIALMATPSTCVQFAPGSEAFRAEGTAPGYRWLELGPDGVIDTGVSRVEGIDFHVDLDSGGYL